MRHDWNLIRLLLIGIEKDGFSLEMGNYTEQQIGSSFILLSKSRYIEVTDKKISLTSKGIQLLGALSNSKSYQKAMEIIESYGGDETKEILIRLIKELKNE